ncbi:hypothetical protein [Aureimonas jatrophae]|uniref:Flagellar assembly protein FliH n=1 Tax=Aureimonas jatrophae TaxID=1166073 RepID=A0A1H0JF54_9HYPH|nr:hypothetical protein [Aureimonas jatrophae]MBB3951436.1 hypothetical protein [Aureimonas jatrophae]SDO42388.1 hypothetical protein SAMN05192530_106159 [Aureimonas jatrophae]
MIPLAQFLADDSGDEFVPLRATPRPTPVAARSLDATPSRAPAAAPVAMRPAFTAAARPVAAPAAVRPAIPDPRVASREVEAERIAFAMERNALREEMRQAVARARQDALQEGGDAVRQDLEAASEARVAELRRQLETDHAAALADARRAWIESEGERLADLVVLQMAVFEDALRQTLNAILRPLVLDARKRQTVDELAGAVKTIAFDGHAVKIAASGPSDLLEALETKLGDHARHVSFDADEAHTDVRIDADQTVIETRLASWLKAVEEALS